MMMSGAAVRDETGTRSLSVENRWAVPVARAVAGAVQLRATAVYAFLLIGVSLTLTALGTHAREVVVSRMSTNLHNLRHGHMGTLVGSAFVSGGGDVFLW